MSITIEQKLHIDYLIQPHLNTDVDEACDVIGGLSNTNKTLAPRYFYDRLGSELFEQICELPEYYPTRTEAAILETYCPQLPNLTNACELVELGSGSSTKTRWLLDAYQAQGYPLRYVPIDVSPTILETSAKELLTDYPTLTIHGLVSTYELALQQLTTSSLSPRMILFLGSTLGNFSQLECDRFFSQLTNALNPGDYFLLGIDLQKPKEILEAAYNDSQGVTAKFNLNALAHLNWRFQGDFNVDLFKHQAIYNESEAQIEMYLIAQEAHAVNLKGLDLKIDFAKGETILTEISRKFNIKTMEQYLKSQGLKVRQVYTDPRQWFGLILAHK